MGDRLKSKQIVAALLIHTFVDKGRDIIHAPVRKTERCP